VPAHAPTAGNGKQPDEEAVGQRAAGGRTTTRLRRWGDVAGRRQCRPGAASGSPGTAASRLRAHAQPILQQRCIGCRGPTQHTSLIARRL